MAKENNNEFGIAGFTLSIVAIISAGGMGLILSILSFIFCTIQQKRSANNFAKTGIILSIIAFVLSIAWIIFSIFYLSTILTGLAQ